MYIFLVFFLKKNNAQEVACFSRQCTAWNTITLLLCSTALTRKLLHMSDFQEGPRTMETVLQMYPTNLQNKIILNNH